MMDPEYRLFEVAESQQGYFTYQQAIEAGYINKNHTYHVKTGDWIKVFRGIYRLAKFPIGEREELVPWFLWSRNRSNIPQGVYSYYTALDLYELSDHMPSKLHMTVPPGFRRMAKIPEILILHKEKLETEDIVTKQGYKVTSPLKTLVDVVKDDLLSEDLLEQAIREAKKRGLITNHNVETNQKYPVKITEKILKIMLKYDGKKI